jgi:hypothetical protein
MPPLKRQGRECLRELPGYSDTACPQKCFIRRSFPQFITLKLCKASRAVGAQAGACPLPNLQINVNTSATN